MSDELQRDLGLIEVIAISMGSMIGSGIFILPGVAFLEVGTPSVVLAFLIGGILTIPTALSAAELSTAIPESGGSYLYIQRGMGPLLGTIAGIGNWLVLNFKTALALIGGIPYLIFIVPAVDNINLFGFEPIIVLSVALTIAFTILNAVSAESAGQAQNIIVGLMMVALGMLLVGSAPSIVNPNPTRIFNLGTGGFLATISLVFISYAGVIKVTSVAEEIKNPAKNIPRGIIISLAVTTFIYVAITYVTVFTVDIVNLAENVPISEGGLNSEGEGAIIAIVAQETIGQIGAVIVVISALLALASTANSGILSASRYPFSMARDNLAPDLFKYLTEDQSIPIYSVLATGLLVIVLVVFFPIGSVARFGGAFQVIVFMLVNLSLVGFREGSVEYYDPDYTCPLYPYMQVFGFLSGIVILAKIGIIALLGSVSIVVLSVIYFYVYAKGKATQEGEVKEGIREDVQESLFSDTTDTLNSSEPYKVMITLDSGYSESMRDTMIQIAKTLGARDHDVTVEVVEFSETMTTKLDETRPIVSDSSPRWAEETENVSYTSVDSQERKESLVQYATYHDIDLIIQEYEESDGRFSVLNSDQVWTLENAPCETILVDEEDILPVDKVTVASNRMFHIPVKMLVADSICQAYNAELEFIDVVDDDISDSAYEALSEYHSELEDALLSDSQSWIIKSKSNLDNSLILHQSSTDLIISELDIGTVRKRIQQADMLRLVRSSGKPHLMVYSEYAFDYNTVYKRILMRYIFRGFE